MGPMEHFKKSQLQLIRLHGIYFIKGLCKAGQIFIRQACDQIQMLMDIPLPAHPAYPVPQQIKVHLPANLLKRCGIGRLNADFQLDQSGTHLFKYGKVFLPEQVGSYLKMKIRHPVIMVQ